MFNAQRSMSNIEVTLLLFGNDFRGGGLCLANAGNQTAEAALQH